MPVVKEYPKDTVILFQFPRAHHTPSLSPFALKLETWIRAAGIQYQVRHLQGYLNNQMIA